MYIFKRYICIYIYKHIYIRIYIYIFIYIYIYLNIDIDRWIDRQIDRYRQRYLDGPVYSNISKRCLPCLHEKLAIINIKDQDNLLNKRSELMNKCGHEHKFLLSNYKVMIDFIYQGNTI